MRDGIARALASPAARPYWRVLVDSYRREQAPQTKDGLAATLGQLARGREQLDELVALAHERANGPSRILLLPSIARSEHGLVALRELRQDPELTPEATHLLRRALGRKATSDRGQPAPVGGTEVSLSTDLDDMRRLFRCLGQQLGFDLDDVGRAVAVIVGLDTDETAELALQAQFDCRAVDVRLVVEMDDPGAVDLFFYVPSQVAGRVEADVAMCADGLADATEPHVPG